MVINNSAKFQFITASHDDGILRANLLKRNHDGKRWVHEYPFYTVTGLTNISKAYNQCDFAKDYLKIYVHHDVFLPEGFEGDLKKAVEWMEEHDPNFGVLGVAGVKLVGNKKEIHGHIMDRGKDWGKPFASPVEVDTLDELLLITKGDFKFDENLDLDWYGADICMQAKAQGRKNYVFDGFCHHNSSRAVGGRTESFFRCQEYFKNKWKAFLPIATTCAHLKND